VAEKKNLQSPFQGIYKSGIQGIVINAGFVEIC
jgi:hypothetical protein